MNDDLARDLQAAVDRMPPRKFNPKTAVTLLRNEGQTVTVLEAGKPILNIDGTPHMMPPEIETHALLSKVMFTGDQWEQIARYLLTETTEKD